MSFKLAERFGLWRCKRGHHAPLIWLRASQRRVPVEGGPREMFYASGMGRLAVWNGWCPRCNRAIEWADHDPRRRSA